VLVTEAEQLAAAAATQQQRQRTSPEKDEL